MIMAWKLYQSGQRTIIMFTQVISKAAPSMHGMLRLCERQLWLQQAVCCGCNKLSVHGMAPLMTWWHDQSTSKRMVSVIDLLSNSHVGMCKMPEYPVYSQSIPLAHVHASWTFHSCHIINATLATSKLLLLSRLLSQMSAQRC